MEQVSCPQCKRGVLGGINHALDPQQTRLGQPQAVADQPGHVPPTPLLAGTVVRQLRPAVLHLVHTLGYCLLAAGDELGLADASGSLQHLLPGGGADAAARAFHSWALLQQSLGCDGDAALAVAHEAVRLLFQEVRRQGRKRVFCAVYFFLFHFLFLSHVVL